MQTEQRIFISYRRSDCQSQENGLNDGLRNRLPPDMLAVFETAVRYQMYHALAVLIVALAAARMDGWLIRGAGWAFTVGIILFSGSLYALTLTGVTTLGAITPVGGLAFLVGWTLLIVAALL